MSSLNKTPNYTVNISEENKVFLWMIPKTGSYHSHLVFSHFDFVTFSTNKHQLRGRFFSHNHFTDLFPNHENYKLICTARNPFTKIISEFKFNLGDLTKHNQINFQRYFEELSNRNFYNFFKLTEKRIPDYFIRIENLWSDYNKIPFVKNSKLNQSGLLYDLCKKKMNSTIQTEKEQDFYTKDMIDHLLDVGRDYFNLLGYTYPY